MHFILAHQNIYSLRTVSLDFITFFFDESDVTVSIIKINVLFIHFNTKHTADPTQAISSC